MRSLKLYSFFLLLIFFAGCSKEELPVNQASYEDVEFSFYRLTSNAIELNADESKSLILSKTDSEVVMDISSLERAPRAGDILVSEWGIDPQDFLMRKIVSVANENGNESTFQTEPAGLMETYEEYYFNSKNEDVVRLRTSTMEIISSAVTAGLSAVIDQLVSSDLLPFDIEPSLDLSGEVNWEAIHPNTAYTFFCEAPNCKANPNKEDFNNNNIWDVAEVYFGGAIGAKIAEDGLFTLEFTDFNVRSYGVKLAATLEGPGFSAQPSGEILARMQLEEEIAEEIDRDLSDNLALVFVPTPLTYPPFSITGVVAPFFDFNISGSPYFDITCLPNKTVTIQFGHINWNQFYPDLEPDFRVFDDQGEVSLSELVLPADINYTLGFTGEMNLDAGVGMGAAITAGEGNKSGASIGGLLKMGTYKNLTGELAVKVNDAVNTSISEGDISGSACFDIGIIHEPIVFTDVNTPDGILGAIFDYQISLPVPIVGDRTSLFAFAKEPVGIDNKLCLGEGTLCSETVQVYTNIAEDRFSEDGESSIEFKFSNNKVNANDAFELMVEIDGSALNIGRFEYNRDYLDKPLLMPYVDIVAAYENASLTIKIVDVETLCEREFSNEKVGLIENCTALFTIIDQPSAKFLSLNLNEINYYKFEVIEPLIKSASLVLPTEEELITLLQQEDCKNPVGILVDNGSGESPYVKLNSHKGYYWVRNELNEPIVLEAEQDVVNGENNWSSFRLRKVSASSYACILLLE